MDLSIVVVNWNTKDLLLQCLESFYGSIDGIETEVFVVDNGSVDGSVAAVKERFSGIILIANPINLGFAKANNQALKESEGHYFLLLNPDTRVKKGTIERLVSFAEAHPEAGVVGGQLLHADGSKQNSIANFPSLATELLNKRLLRWLWPRTFPGKERDYSEPVEVDSVIGACMMVRRQAADEVGWLDEDYFLFLEETDWCFRMKKAGWKIYHHPLAELYHFQGKSAEPERKRARVEYYRSRYHFFKRNRGVCQWLVLVLGTVLRLSVEVISAAVICVLTLFRLRQWRQKLSTFAYVMWWHLRFCPEDMGLNPVALQTAK
jgi:GT2 family glycosyltransferase